LSRRVPGASLAPGLRLSAAQAHNVSSLAPTAPKRDPDSELAAFDGFMEGLARATGLDPQPPVPDPVLQPRPPSADFRQTVEPTK
jgi:hypothetical protein